MSNQFKKNLYYFVFSLVIIAWTTNSFAVDRIARLGVGYSNQLKNNVPSLSFKLQKSRSMAFGGLIGISSSDSSGGIGAAAKLYRIIFDEPNLIFYSSFTGGIIKKKSGSENNSGFQFDATLGSEFSFAGLQSLGFSIEFGVSANKTKDFVFETVGNSFVVSGVHFYL